jgi:hypothetical protein
MIVTLYAGFLERRSAVVSPETPALLYISSGFLYYNREYTPNDDNIGHDEWWIFRQLASLLRLQHRNWETPIGSSVNQKRTPNSRNTCLVHTKVVLYLRRIKGEMHGCICAVLLMSVGRLGSLSATILDSRDMYIPQLAIRNAIRMGCRGLCRCGAPDDRDLRESRSFI